MIRRWLLLCVNLMFFSNPFSAFSMGILPSQIDCTVAGGVTINEVYSLGNSNFVELKVNDSTVDVDDLKIRICSPRGNSNSCSTYSLRSADKYSPYYVVNVGNNALKLEGNSEMDISLYEVTGFFSLKYHFYDYLSVNGFDYQKSSCDFPYDTHVETFSNHKGIQRSPDGVGDWEEIAGPGNNGENTRGESNDGSAGLNHFEFVHDGHGLTCAAETVTIKAWVDAAETIPYVGELEVTLPDLGWLNGTGQTLTFPGAGIGVELKLQHTTAETVTLEVASSTPEAIAAVSCIGGNPNACDLVFHDSGFLLTVADGRSCTALNGTIQAVSLAPDGKSCIGDDSFALQTKDIGFWYGYVDPGSGAIHPAIDNTAIDTTVTATGFSLIFDADAKVDYQLTYNDAGSLNLYARHEGSGDSAGLVMVGSTTAPIVVAPKGFVVTSADSGGNTLNNVTTSGTPALAAGLPFSATIQAVCSDGTVTPNYAWFTELTAQTPFAPATGVLGTLNNGTVLATDFSNGQAIPTSLNYTEVGNFTLQADAQDYLGSAMNITGTTSTPAGRFHPHHFDITATSPTFVAGCSAFTYLDQPFYFDVKPEVTIIAKNAFGDTTSNYAGSWWRLADIGNNCIDPTMPAGVSIDLSVLAHSPTTTDADATTPGQVNTTFTGPLACQRPSANIAPFDADMHLTFTVDDGDAKYSSDGIFDLPLPFRAGDGNELRHGRLRLENAHGSELLPLLMPVFVEYFDGSSFVVNTLDGCTSIALLLAQFTFNATPSSIADADALSVVGGGFLQLDWGNPAYPTGHVDVNVELSTLPWLQYDWDGDGNHDNAPPTARATFGIYRGSEHIIYLLETTWR